MVYPDVVLKRQLGVLPNLYQAVLHYVLWVTCDITYGDFCNASGNAVAKR